MQVKKRLHASAHSQIHHHILVDPPTRSVIPTAAAAASCRTDALTTCGGGVPDSDASSVQTASNSLLEANQKMTRWHLDPARRAGGGGSQRKKQWNQEERPPHC